MKCPLLYRFIFCQFISAISLLFLFLYPYNGLAEVKFVKDSVAVVVCNKNPGEAIRFSGLGRMQFRSPDGYFNFGLTGSEYHCIILKITAPEVISDQFLWIDNTSIDTVMIYKIGQNENDLLYQGGTLVKYNTGRTYVWHSVPLDISAVPSYYLIALKAPQKNINLRYEIGDKKLLQKSYQQYERFVFFYIGIACMIALIILVAFLLFRKKIFAAYLGYIFCISVWIVAHYGCVFPFVHPQFPAVNNILKPVTSIVSALFLLLVLRNVFQKNLQSHPRFDTLLRRTQLSLFILATMMFLLCVRHLDSWMRTSLITAWHVGLFIAVGLAIITPLKFYYSGTLAKIFSTAMFVISATAIVQLFTNSGLILNYFINDHGMAVGTIIENSIMSFGLFYGLLVERRNKELQLLSLEEEQTKILKKLISVQDNERKRIAGDLHDNIGPLLAALKINFRRFINVREEQKQLELMQKTEAIIDDSILEIRNVAHNLMPKNLSSNGLINTLSDYFEDVEQLYNKKILFNHDVQSIFEPELQMNVYRVVSELVMNATRHSDADAITVCIHSKFKTLSVFIQDNGRGFEVKHNGHKKSLGLQSAESRVHYLKGNFSLQSEVGKGTKVSIEIPI